MARATKSVAEKVTEKATDAIKLPVTFKEFSKNPVKVKYIKLVQKS